MNLDDTAPPPRRVWDLPTRLCHWLLALTVVGSIVSAKIGGNAMDWHVRLGLVALVLLAFRLVWGFVGGHWSRFSQFVYAPTSLLAYLRGASGPPGGAGAYDAGHSPLGALSVWAMLGLLMLQVASGLVADDEIATTGPLNRYAPLALVEAATRWHRSVGQYGLILLIVLHVAAIAWYWRARRRNLVGPMWHGDKALPPHLPASRDSLGTRLLALLVLAVALGLAGWVWRLGMATP